MCILTSCACVSRIARLAETYETVDAVLTSATVSTRVWTALVAVYGIKNTVYDDKSCQEWQYIMQHIEMNASSHTLNYEIDDVIFDTQEIMKAQSEHNTIFSISCH